MPQANSPRQSGEAGDQSQRAKPEYGLMWWLYTWSGHEIYAARGSEGDLIVVVPDQKSVTAIPPATASNTP